jgi:hypothetical protein
MLVGKTCGEVDRSGHRITISGQAMPPVKYKLLLTLLVLLVGLVGALNIAKRIDKVFEELAPPGRHAAASTGRFILNCEPTVDQTS